MNRYALWIIAISLLNLMASCSQSSGDKEVESGESVLWRIEGNDLSEPSYVFGTMHLIPAEDFHMGEHLVKIAQDADLIVMELDMDDINLMELSDGMLLPAGQSLSDLMDSSDYNLLKSVIIDSLGTNSMMWLGYSKMKPFFVMSAITESMMGKTKSYEQELMAIAEERQIEILGLEEAAEQMAMIDTIPLEKQVDILMESIDQLDTMELYLHRLIRFYQAQQLDSIDAIMHDPEFEDFMEYEGVLLNDRNQRWISRMGEFMKKGTTLFAVGAGHLPGDEGVLNLLREAGYEVTAVSTE